MRNTLLILGHPRKESFNHALLESYKKGLIDSKLPYDTLILADMNFENTLYDLEQPITTSMLNAQEKIRKADPIVFFFPGWWGTGPAILKLFIDTVFTPGFAFKYLPSQKNRVTWDKYLTDKTARVVITLDAPPLLYSLIYRQPAYNMMKRSVLGFCGVSRVDKTFIGSVKTSSLEKRKDWLKQLYALGIRGK